MSLRNYGSKDSSNCVAVPITNKHKLRILWSGDYILVIDLISTNMHGYSIERGIYCHNCSNEVFLPEQINILNNLITDLVTSSSSNLSDQFDELLRVV